MDGTWTSYSGWCPTPRQQAYLKSVALDPLRQQRDILAEILLSIRTLTRWRTDTRFREMERAVRNRADVAASFLLWQAQRDAAAVLASQGANADRPRVAVAAARSVLGSGRPFRGPLPGA